MSFITLFLTSTLAFSQSLIQADHVKVQLLPPAQENQPLGIHYQIDPEWHIYWKNPGDSGAAPKFSTEDANIKEILWPYPERLPIKDLTNFGYSGETVLFLDLETNKSDIKIDLEWLVCKIECIPGFGSLIYKPKELANKESPIYRKYWNQIPKSLSLEETSFISQNESHFKFELKKDASHFSEIYVFPENGLKFQTKVPEIQTLENSLLISIPVNANLAPKSQHENFTIVLKGSETQFFDVQVATIQEQDFKDFLWGLVGAFLGGLILNAMPCVFPILSLKIFSFLKEADSQKIRKSSWHYTYGVLFTFTLIGLGLTLLRLIGESVGWGYQLQSPWLVYLLIVLFFLMALNFLGFFELGNALALWAGHKSNISWLSGSFGTGVLAVVVASPCTAPFMGTALGLTLLLPWYQSLLIFVALGLGMAFPMLLLAYNPKLSSWLPKPGLWMDRLKQLMSFPMLSTALWLLWVLGNQKGEPALYLTLASLLAFSFLIWLKQILKKSLAQAINFLVFLVILFLIAQRIHSSSLATNSPAAQSNWSSYKPGLVLEKRKLQNVFVDFTAAWCITCQINKRGVLDTEEIQSLFKDKNTFLIRADWTNHDPEITKALAAFNRNSVPLYVYYPQSDDKEAQLLPQILTKDMIRELYK